MKLLNESKQNRIQQHRAGKTQLQADRERRERDGCVSFEDVRRACHRFLLEREPGYREKWEETSEHRTRCASNR